MSSLSFIKELYGNPDGTVPATFQVIYMIGWKPAPSQPQPLERGSGNVSMKDIYRIDDVIKEKAHELAQQAADENEKNK